MSEVCNITKRCERKLDNGYCGLNIVCEPIVEQCVGCARSEEGYCRAFASPAVRWRVTPVCPMASHIKAEAKVEKKINPLKQSKQAMRAKKG